MTTTNALSFVAQIEIIIAQAPGKLQRSPAVLDAVEDIVNEAVLDDATAELQMILDLYSVFLRPGMLKLLGEHLDMSDGIPLIVDVEMTDIDDCIPVEIDEEDVATRKYKRVA